MSKVIWNEVPRYSKDEKSKFYVEINKKRILYSLLLPLKKRIHICNSVLPNSCTILVEKNRSIHIIDKMVGDYYSDETATPLEVYVNMRLQSPPN